MPTLDARGIQIAWSERGSGAAALLVHETAADALVWAPLIGELGDRARAIAYDRRGWGRTTAPEGYRRTTIEEQSEDAAELLEASGAGPAAIAGAGVGGVVALDLLLRRPDLVTGAVLIEPPLLQLLPTATEALSQDRRRLEAAAATGESVMDLYLGGGLPALGAEILRLPQQQIEDARERPASVVAEMGIATAWRASLPQLAAAERPSAVVTTASTPALVRDASEALAGMLAGARARELDAGSRPPHLGAPGALAELVLELTP
jgi:pimeloyl-ACP methyl ester carboxylesterase